MTDETQEGTDAAIAAVLALPGHEENPGGPSNELVAAALDEAGEVPKERRLLPVYILTAALALLVDEARWTQGEYAADENGRDTGKLNAPTATCWCAEGAVYACAMEAFDRSRILLRATATDSAVLACGMLNARIQSYYGNENDTPVLTSWNDDQVHRAVVRLFRETIEAA